MQQFQGPLIVGHVGEPAHAIQPLPPGVGARVRHRAKRARAAEDVLADAGNDDAAGTVHLHALHEDLLDCTLGSTALWEPACT